MFDYIKDLIPIGRFNRPGNKMSPEYITIHDTANTSPGANALMHARYLKTTDREVSWHYTVDDTNVVQHLPWNEIGWHAGTSQGNNNSIGVEICMNSDGDRTKAEENAQLLCVDLMNEVGIVLDHIVQHNHWSGKNCPQVLRARENGWANFIEGIDKIINPPQPEPQPEPITSLVEPPKEESNMFKDFNQVSDYAKSAVQKAEAKGIFVGDENGNFNPQAPISRQDVAVLFDRAGLLE